MMHNNFVMKSKIVVVFLLKFSGNMIIKIIDIEKRLENTYNDIRIFHFIK